MNRRRRPRPSPLPPATGADGPAPSVEDQALDAVLHGHLRAVVPLLPGRCPLLITALLDRPGLTYREIAGELGISQGSIGPVRSRCLECARRLLAARGWTTGAPG
ncbi:hypothetical protein [Streptomyces sp. HB2AG]|uniref:hypothetical protein n=1 Tax=Streptomyces sp. HB2AG TaxID=2983400 RepID=UPI003FA7DF30